MNDYPLCEKLGIQLLYPADGFKGYWGNFIRAEDLEKILSEATVVYGFFDSDGAQEFSELKVIGSNRGAATHQAKLLCINPIVEETATDILRDIYEHNSFLTATMRDRIKKVLGES